jgi:2-octaprenylphenol hydroxylase
MIIDVAIMGAGLVGASLARALAGSGLGCALVDGSPPQEPQAASWDTRVYALSPATQSFLDELGVWRMLDPGRVEPVVAMHVFGDRSSKLHFSAYECGVERLATIVEAGALQRALWRSLQGQPGLQIHCPARPASLQMQDDCVELRLADGSQLCARLLVAADGASSWVRETAGIPAHKQALQHVAVVANFACDRAHRGVAYQWFRGDGVLAWLPLPGKRFSMVWSTPEPNSRELLAASSEDLCDRVAEAGGGALGRLDLVTPAAAFPVAPLSVAQRVRPRLALIGDAAHVIHPLAGQGVNLGFGDARALARVLREPAAARDPGERLMLRRFERQRSEDILAMRLATEGLQRLFSARSPAVAMARNLGLTLTDRFSVIKNLLARRAMGDG